jgi:hypothetical protein
MVTPAAEREAVAHLTRACEVSQRRACRTIEVSRSSKRYRALLSKPKQGMPFECTFGVPIG